MANIDAPFGMRPVRHLNGSPYNGATERYFISADDGTALFVGDLVKFEGDCDANGVPRVIRAEASNPKVLGVIVSFEPTNDLALKHRVASTARYCNVVTSPDVVFEIQEDSAGNSVEATEMSMNADVIYTVAGSTVSGRSGMELDSTSANTTAELQLRILRLMPRVDNAIGNYAVWEVLINEHEFKQTTGV